MMATRRVTEHEIGKALLLILGLVVLAIYSFALSINVSFLTGLKVAGGVFLLLKIGRLKNSIKASVGFLLFPFCGEPRNLVSTNP